MSLNPQNQNAVLNHIGSQDLEKVRQCLVTATEGYFKTYPPELRNHSPRSKASLISDGLHQVIGRMFNGPGYNFHDDGNRPMVSIRDEVTIWFRKVDLKGRVRWNDTNFASLYKNQEDLESESICKKAVHLIASYGLDLLGNNITGAYLMCPLDTKIIWEKTLMEDGKGTQSEMHFEPHPPLVGPKITIKRRNNRLADGTNGA